jgi:hypothetical protein
VRLGCPVTSAGRGILAAGPPARKDGRYFAKELNDRSIAVTAREGVLRFSPHLGNGGEEAERVLAALGGLI